MESLGEFPPSLARAIVAVLRRAGLPAMLGEEMEGEIVVLVPAENRGAALATLAARMEEIREEVAASEARDPAPEAPRPDEDDAEHDTPLVFERLRSLGVVAMVLAPLLVITLAAPGMPMWLAVGIYIGALAGLVAWRNRSRADAS